MFNINKILKPRYLLVLLVLGGGALFTTMLQAAQCVSTANGDLTEQTTFGTYQGSAQTGCGSDLTLDYLINSGTTVTWDGSSGALQGEMEIESGGTLRVEGDVSLNSVSSFQNSGILDSGSYDYTTLRNDNTEITTIAGKLDNYADGTGENAEFRYLNRMLRIGTNIYVTDDYRIRKVDSTSGAVSTLKTSGDYYNYIDRWTSDGTDIYFSSYFSSSSGGSGYKLYKMSSTGVVSELDMVSDNGSASFIFSNYLYGLTSDGTDLFAWSGSGSSKFHRITLQPGSGGTNMVTPYTTGGESLSYVNGIEKIGDSLFALYSNKIYEIELNDNPTSDTAIAAGSKHTCAILGDASVSCWGLNDSGQLGLGDTNNRGDFSCEMGDILTLVDLGSGRTAKAIVAGGSHTCAILDNSAIKCWGRSNEGQMGRGGKNGNSFQVGDESDEMGNSLDAIELGTGRTATAIAAGKYHNCAILDNSSIKCWGSNTAGQLGLGDTINRGDNSSEMGGNLPVIGL